jgi:hypothetical protein
MEIRFGCPICTKYFISLAGAQQHVVEHKQVWKCGHCVMLFGTPTLAIQHWKEVHPGLQGQLESIDSPSQIVERLSKGITIHRVQLNMKSLLKDKSSLQSAQSLTSEVTGNNSFTNHFKFRIHFYTSYVRQEPLRRLRKHEVLRHHHKFKKLQQWRGNLLALTSFLKKT